MLILQQAASQLMLDNRYKIFYLLYQSRNSRQRQQNTIKKWFQNISNNRNKTTE